MGQEQSDNRAIDEALTGALPSSSRVSGGLIFFLATAALNASNFGFQVFVSRALGPDVYSALSALLALLVIASVPLSALQLACASAQARLEGPADATHVLRAVALAGALASLALLLTHGVVGGYLQIDSIGPLWWLCAWLVLATLSAVPQGLLIGQSRFTALGVTALVGAGLCRLGFGAFATELNLGVNGGMAATAMGQCVTLLLLMRAVRAPHTPRRTRLRLSAMEGAQSTFALTGLAVFSAVDTVLARHTLTATASGYYSAAATGGRIALFAPGAIALLAFPRFVRSAERGGDNRRDFGLALAGVAGVGLLVVIAVLAVPRLIITLLFGAAYIPATHQLTILAPAGAMLGCLGLATYYHLAHGSGLAFASWVGAAALAGAEARVRLQGDDLAMAVLITATVFAVVSVVAAFVSPSMRFARGTSRVGRARGAAAAAVAGGESGIVVPPDLGGGG